MEFDFGDLFTQSARQALVLTHAKGLRFLFDCQGPPLRVRADEQQIRRALYRLFCAALDVVQDGFVFFTARVSDVADGRTHAQAAIACSGGGVPVDSLRQVLQRLQLEGVDGMSDDALREPDHGVVGRCPSTGGMVRFVQDSKEGSLFTLELDLPAEIDGAAQEPLDAHGARVWLIGDAQGVLASLEHRLQRLGWAASSMDNIEEAARRIEGTPARPALVVAHECQRVTLERLRWLWALLPPSTEVVMSVELDSPLLSQRASELDIEIRPCPFSPSELRQFTRRAQGSAVPSGTTQPAPLTLSQRPRALVVDDNAVNQLVASGMLQVLGFEVETANDGQQAIDSCCRMAPDLVLMDVHMPNMDGLESTRRLRLMQQHGDMPRFPIVAATADATALGDCLLAGMDGHLPKPLMLGALDAELKRVMPSSR